MLTVVNRARHNESLKMAQNLHKEIVRDANPLLPALKVEDKVECHEQVAGILDQLDEDKQVTLLFDALLKSINNESRKRIVEELTRIGNPKAVELLGSIMTDDFEPEIQLAAVQALRAIGSERAIDLLMSGLRLDVFPNRAAAIALGDFKSEKVVDALIDATRNPLFPVDAAISSLAKIGSDRATEHLITLMGNDTGSLDAMEALIRLGTDRAIEALIKAWSSPDSVLTMRLSMNLSRLKHKHLIPFLCERVKSKTFSSHDRLAAVDMLGIIGTENELPVLESTIKDSTESEILRWRALRAAQYVSYEVLKIKAERERALEETRGFIAHEFRHALTPLNAYVKMLDEALAQPYVNKERLSRLTVRIRKQTDTAFDLVNQYLDYSRPLKPQFAETDINKLVEESLEEFNAEIEKGRIRLQSHFAEDAVANVDKQMLAQVFRNVIANAIQAMDHGGSLLASTELYEDDILITIRDTGAGIKPDHLSRLFEVGFTTKPGMRGAGIGLALSKRIIEEAHHGSISIVKNAPDQGVSVKISLPKQQTEIRNGRHDLALASR